MQVLQVAELDMVRPCVRWNTSGTFASSPHVDHGKSTLADRLIQACDGISDREFRDQLLDSMEIERERGITIKSNTVSLEWMASDGVAYQFNLIDTPGHVDFSHEVRRSLMACEGALLLIDAAQGVEAQTVANLYLAMEYDLEIIPVLNKIDLPAADPERVLEQVESELGLDPDSAVQCSAKNGVGIEQVLEAIVGLPSPKASTGDPLQALVFDAQYDAYRGVVLTIRVVAGTMRTGDGIRLMHSGKEYKIEELGLLQLKRVKTKTLTAGEVGLRHLRYQSGTRDFCRRHDHVNGRWGRGAFAGLQRSGLGGVLFDLSHGQRRLRGSR